MNDKWLLIGRGLLVLALCSAASCGDDDSPDDHEHDAGAGHGGSGGSGGGGSGGSGGGGSGGSGGGGNGGSGGGGSGGSGGAPASVMCGDETCTGGDGMFLTPCCTASEKCGVESATLMIACAIAGVEDPDCADGELDLMGMAVPLQGCCTEEGVCGGFGANGPCLSEYMGQQLYAEEEDGGGPPSCGD